MDAAYTAIGKPLVRDPRERRDVLADRSAGQRARRRAKQSVCGGIGQQNQPRLDRQWREVEIRKPNGDTQSMRAIFGKH